MRGFIDPSSLYNMNPTSLDISAVFHTDLGELRSLEEGPTDTTPFNLARRSLLHAASGAGRASIIFDGGETVMGDAAHAVTDGHQVKSPSHVQWLRDLCIRIRAGATRKQLDLSSKGIRDFDMYDIASALQENTRVEVLKSLSSLTTFFSK